MSRTVLLGTISSVYHDWVPYPVGCLISHCNKNKKIRDNYTFLEPIFENKWDKPEIHEKLKKADILGLTCYVWNQVANDKIAQIYKEYRPDGMVIYGGPNVTTNMERDYVDHFIMGPGEIEFEKLLDPTADSAYAIPTPYTDGLFDDIIKDGFVAFETNRGCPYGCAFCDWGGVARSKITKASEEETNATIEHVLKHKPKRLEILDANFGIFERDLNFVKHIVDKKQRDDMWLTFAGFAKNGSKWLPEIMNLTMDNFNDRLRNVKISLQTLSPEVLNTIDRNNIKPEKLLQIINELDNIDISSELIIGLPGETADSWRQTLKKHKELGITFGRGYPLYVLPNTPMATPEYREKYKIKTKRMVLPDGETFEMIYECYSYDLEEIKQIYLEWNRFNTFHNFFGEEWDREFPPEMKIHEVEAALERIFKPEDVYHLTGFDYEFLHKSLGRGKELIYMRDSGKFNIPSDMKELRSPFACLK